MKRFAFAFACLATTAAALGAVPAAAKVSQVSGSGFVVRHLVQMPAPPEETWAVLVKPAVWWDSTHTWSEDAANLSLDARAGGCFCEILPNAASPKAAPRGSVEHMRVLYVERPRVLRLSGGLGPLQGEATAATMTIQLKADGKGGTQLLLEYVVGGYSRTPFEKLAPAVDAMLGEQVRRLSEKLGGAFSAAFPMPEAAPRAEPSSEPSAGDAVVPAIEAEPVDPALPVDGIVPLSEEPPPSEGKIRGR
ncbi:MAG TPA: SRPBCC family protein [Novosphingobium sp.]|nr:SRPBCC family protein [Novosphingobium sp.]